MTDKEKVQELFEICGINLDMYKSDTESKKRNIINLEYEYLGEEWVSNSLRAKFNTAVRTINQYAPKTGLKVQLARNGANVVSILIKKYKTKEI